MLCSRERNQTMNNEGVQRIKEAGLKLTPQRREVYKAMQELRHATVEDIIERVQSRNREVTVSTIYRILDSFRSANILSFIYHPDTGSATTTSRWRSTITSSTASRSRTMRIRSSRS